MKDVLVSVIICTKDRPEALAACIESVRLSGSGSEAYEIIVVDQSDENKSVFKEANVTVVSSNTKGLSSARNEGLRVARGGIIAFLDDDALAGPDYHEIVMSSFGDTAIDAMSGRIVIKDADLPYSKSQGTSFEHLNIFKWNRMLGGNFALRREVFDKVGLFDERFGAGREWASGEETDLFFRMRYAGLKIVYEPNLVVYHPREDVGHTDETLRAKLYFYGKGHGALFAKHIHGYKKKGMLVFFIWSLLKPALRIIQYTLMMKRNAVKLHFSIFKGKIAGYREYTKTDGYPG